MTTTYSEKREASGEFRARLPWIDKIVSDILKHRATHGITKTLRLASACTYTENITVDHRKQMISACNFSASQCVKELKRRGEKL